MALSDVLPVIESRGTTAIRPVRRPIPPAAVQVQRGLDMNPAKPRPVVETWNEVQ
jgi:hypothetical protein